MADEPREVALENAALRIAWRDGHQSIYPAHYLRLRCQCAGCMEEMTHRPLLDPDSVPEDIEVLDYLTVGRYGLQLLFSDAHDTGIYGYEVLRAICPCQECVAQRGGEQG